MSNIANFSKVFLTSPEVQKCILKATNVRCTRQHSFRGNFFSINNFEKMLLKELIKNHLLYKYTYIPFIII